MRNKIHKKICIISTGGTILARQTTLGYESAKRDFKDIFAGILSRFSGFEFDILEPFSVGSQDMSDELLLRLANIVEQNASNHDAIIITHGSDTLEESAFFLSLVNKSKIPIMLTAAMFPPGHKNFDGTKNLEFLLNSLKKNSKNGVFVGINSILISANNVIKLKSKGKDAFFDLKNKSRILEFQVPKNLPNVVIIYADASFKKEFYNLKNADGIVICAMGAGTMNKCALEYFSSLAKLGKIVVKSSRSAIANVAKNGEIDDEKYGFIASNTLSAAKSRILLSLAISNGANKEQIQKYFEIFV